MNLIDRLKGVFRRMFSANDIESVLHVQPTMSQEMKDAIELWEQMYKNKSPWVMSNENLKSLGLPAMIASEKARTATIEMNVKITGESERAKFISEQFKKVTSTIRKNLEYGIALGGLVIKPYVVMGPDNQYKIEFNFVKATDFYPLAFSANGKITEAAFIERIFTKEAVFSKVEYHQLVGTTLTVRNLAFKTVNSNTSIYSTLDGQLGTEISLSEVPEWSNLAPQTIIDNVDSLLFAYFKMPQANTIDLTSPLGVSGFSKAVDLIHDADEQYTDLLWEFEGGQLAVDVDRTAFNPLIDKDGKQTVELPKFQDRLFRRNLDLGEDDTYNVFSPNLRDANIINGLNNILMHIEDVCDLARGTLSNVAYSEARTATELKILKQRTFSANKDIQTELQGTLEQVITIMDKYCDLYNIVDGSKDDYEVAYDWDDSILVDKDTERQVDMIDVDKGRMSKIEYRMKWYGETEAQAQESLDKISDEQQKSMEMQQKLMMQNSVQNNSGNNDNKSNDSNNKNVSDGTDPAARQQKLNRSNDSNEPTKV